MTAKVVQLRPRTKATTSPAFDDAWLAFPEQGRLRSSRKESWPEWVKASAEVGEADLVARVKRYAAEDKDHRKECGPPAFHRWLKWGRWEHWAPRSTDLAPTPEAKFSDPELRASFHFKFTDERPRRWLDRCQWDAETREIFDAPPVRQEWMAGPFRTWALGVDVRGLRFK